jgi:two-component system cell cycle response regulator
VSHPRSTVLVADDAPAALSLLVAALEKEGVEVVMARDGTAALEVACGRRIDLLIASATLPGLDALQLLRALRQNVATRDVRVILTFAQDDREVRLAALQLGADDVLRVPFDTEDACLRAQRSFSTKRRIDELVQENDRLEKLSITDGLTQLNNQRYFQERLKDEFRRAQRYDDPLALILMDLDHFKQINDVHGHPAGDQVLKDVAACLRKNVRETDMVARYGGEEFAAILPKTHLSGALTVAERIRRELISLSVGPGGGLRITASFGVAGYPCRTIISAEHLLRAADEALYRAKNEGRNKICLFPSSLEPDPATATAS